MIDLGATATLGAFSCPPPTDGGRGGEADRSKFVTCADGQTWVPAAEGEFANIRANPREQTLALTAPVAGRFIRLVAVHAHADVPPTVAELSVTRPPVWLPAETKQAVPSRGERPQAEPGVGSPRPRHEPSLSRHQTRVAKSGSGRLPRALP